MPVRRVAAGQSEGNSKGGQFVADHTRRDEPGQVVSPGSGFTRKAGINEVGYSTPVVIEGRTNFPTRITHGPNGIVVDHVDGTSSLHGPHSTVDKVNLPDHVCIEHHTRGETSLGFESTSHRVLPLDDGGLLSVSTTYYTTGRALVGDDIEFAGVTLPSDQDLDSEQCDALMSARHRMQERIDSAYTDDEAWALEEEFDDYPQANFWVNSRTEWNRTDAEGNSVDSGGWDSESEYHEGAFTNLADANACALDCAIDDDLEGAAPEDYVGRG